MKFKQISNSRQNKTLTELSWHEKNYLSTGLFADFLYNSFSNSINVKYTFILTTLQHRF